MKKPGHRVGRLLMIGGAEDPDPACMTILPHLVRMAGRSRARIVVCSSPSRRPREKARHYRRLLEGIGVADVHEAAVSRRSDADRSEILRLTEELRATREQTRVMLEEHDRAMESLKALEEETQSSNEELQSTNEELETAKEELQSLNEELSTTNDELRFRNREL